MLIYVYLVRSKAQGSKMNMVYLVDETGLSTIKNFETSLGILVWWLKLEVHQNKIKIYRNKIKMHSTHLKNKREGEPLCFCDICHLQKLLMH